MDRSEKFSQHVQQIAQSEQFQSLLANLFQTQLKSSSEVKCLSEEKDKHGCSGEESVRGDAYAVMPPFEFFAEIPPALRLEQFFRCLKVGQLLVGKVHSLHFVSKCGVYTGVLLNLLYSDDTDPSFALDSKQDSAATHLCRFVLCQKTSLPSRKSVDIAKDQIWKISTVEIITDLSPSSEFAIVADFKQIFNPDINDENFGGISSSQNGLYFDSLAPYYKRTTILEKSVPVSYDSFLHKIVGFCNPKCVSSILSSPSLLNCPDEVKVNSSLWGQLGSLCVVGGGSRSSPSKEITSSSSSTVVENAETLRRNQNNSRALKSVGKGVDCFKQDRHVEAMQHFNIALDVDPKCVEGLVARGALHTKLEVFPDAITDFKQALTLKPQHRNANKYLLEAYLGYAKREKIRENFLKSEKLYREAQEQFAGASADVVQLINSLLKELANTKQSLLDKRDNTKEQTELSTTPCRESLSPEKMIADRMSSVETSVTAKQIQKWLNKEKQNLKKKKKKERRSEKNAQKEKSSEELNKNCENNAKEENDNRLTSRSRDRSKRKSKDRGSSGKKSRSKERSHISGESPKEDKRRSSNEKRNGKSPVPKSSDKKRFNENRLRKQRDSSSSSLMSNSVKNESEKSSNANKESCPVHPKKSKRDTLDDDERRRVSNNSLSSKKLSLKTRATIREGKFPSTKSKIDSEDRSPVVTMCTPDRSPLSTAEPIEKRNGYSSPEVKFKRTSRSRSNSSKRSNKKQRERLSKSVSKERTQNLYTRSKLPESSEDRSISCDQRKKNSDSIQIAKTNGGDSDRKNAKRAAIDRKTKLEIVPISDSSDSDAGLKRFPKTKKGDKKVNDRKLSRVRSRSGRRKRYSSSISASPSPSRKRKSSSSRGRSHERRKDEGRNRRTPEAYKRESVYKKHEKRTRSRPRRSRSRRRSDSRIRKRALSREFKNRSSSKSSARKARRSRSDSR